MQLTSRGRYAVMAMVDIATRQTLGCDGGPVCIAEIAQRQQLSHAYLEQLFGRLRRAGLVASARGPGGGYRLARPCDAIAIADIVAAVDEEIRATRCKGGAPGCLRGTDVRCQTHDLWEELGLQILLFLRGVSLADVVNGRVLGRARSLPAWTAPTSAAAE